MSGSPGDRDVRAVGAISAQPFPACSGHVVSTGRKTSNLSRTLKTMERYGFVNLRRGERGKIRPEVPYQAISLELSFDRNRSS